MNKLKNWALVILSILLVTVTGLLFFTGYQLSKEQTELDIKDAQIMQLNTELGIAKSTLLEQQILNKRYKEEIDQFPKKLQKLIDEHNLTLSSRDETIAQLKNRVEGGTTTVVIKEPDGNTNDSSTNNTNDNIDSFPDGLVISYEWNDPHKRFHLIDPNILVQGNETFTAQQLFKIKGWIFQGKGGKLQIRRLELQEVVQTGVNNDGSPSYNPIADATSSIVDSTFEYIDFVETNKRSFLDIFTFRILGTFDTSLHPGVSLEFINLGEYIDFANVGLSIGVAFDTSNPLNGSLEHSRVSAGLHYLLLRPWIDSNLGVGISLGLPFSDLSSPVLAGTLIFAITR